MFKSCYFVSMTVLTVSLTLGCKFGRSQPKSGLQFSITNPQNSILRDIEAFKGKLPVCLALIGFEEPEHDEQVTKFTELFTKAANSWNSLLSDNPAWPVKSSIELKVNSRRQRCPKPSSGFAVNVWKKPEGFKRDYCDTSSAVVCAGGAQSGEKAIYIGPVNRAKPANIYSYFVILHEYGHLLSMGDTYEISGRSEWKTEQPPSVMNGQNVPPDSLSEDDKIGLSAVLNAVKTGRRACGTYGTPVDMQKNAWNAMLCNPNAGGTNAHIGTPSNLAENPTQNPSEKPSQGPSSNQDGKSTGSSSASLALADATPMTAAGIKLGRWSLSGYDQSEYMIIVSEIEGSPEAFRTVMYINGASASETGLTYYCTRSGSAKDAANGSPRTCKAAQNGEFVIQVKSAELMILKTPSKQEGVELRFMEQ